MCELIEFPQPDCLGTGRKPMTLEEFNACGAVHVNVEAISRWLRGFRPFDAAITAVTAESREEAVTWWRSHIEDFRTALRVRGVKDDRIEALRQEYTEQVRQHVKQIRGAQLPMFEWNGRKARAVIEHYFLKETIDPKIEGGSHA